MKVCVIFLENISTKSFISHMVQMKAQKLNNSWKIVITLYPTWFRWKFTSMRYAGEVPHFISHMVQMKVY